MQKIRTPSVLSMKVFLFVSPQLLFSSPHIRMQQRLPVLNSMLTRKQANKSLGCKHSTCVTWLCHSPLLTAFSCWQVYTFFQDVQSTVNPAYIIKTDDDLYTR